MKAFVHWTGLLSLLAGIGFFVPAMPPPVPGLPPGMATQLLGAEVAMIGLFVMLCARDLRRRGAIVGWVGVLRLIVCAVMGAHALSGNGGALLAAGALTDGAIGVGYLLGVPRHLGVSLFDLLRDRVP